MLNYTTNNLYAYTAVIHVLTFEEIGETAGEIFQILKWEHKINQECIKMMHISHIVDCRVPHYY